MELLVKEDFRGRKEESEMQNGLVYMVWVNLILFSAISVGDLQSH